MALFVFDFDKTLINIDTDQFVIEKFNIQIPAAANWFETMRYVIEVILTQIGVQRLKELLSDIKIRVKNIPHNSIIVSDSNDLFINTILEANGLKGAFKEIHCNRIVKNSLVPYGSHSCTNPICAKKPNMCKGMIIDNLRKKYTTKIIFIGDGANDYCATTRLLSNEFALVRAGYKLDELLPIDVRFPRWDSYEYLDKLIMSIE